MAGNDGDCAFYRGHLFIVSEDSPSVESYTIDNQPGQRQGGIWMGGAAPVVDAAGNLWVAVGNGSVRTAGVPYDHSDAIMKFDSSLHVKGFFTPSTWAQQNAQDLDISSTPTLLPGGLTLIAGKSDSLYVEHSAALSGIGGQVATMTRTCPSDIDGGSVAVGDVAVLPCLSGPEAVEVRPTSSGGVAIRARWQAAVGGGPPLVVGSNVWTVGRDGTLHELSLATGAVEQTVAIGQVANHFTTPAFGDGELLVANATSVLAFAAHL